MFKNFFFFILLLSVFQYSYAQNNAAKRKDEIGLLIGNVLDAATNKPIAFATLSLIPSVDSIQKLMQVADKNGAFEFEKIPFGTYKLSITATSYATYTLDSIYFRAERYDFNLGDIRLNSSDSGLMEVIVYSEKPLIENKDGKLIYNVGESALSNGSSTAELLKTMPLINNDPNGKILLKGKEPKILIDDKPTDLNAEQLRDLLESLPGSSIEKIELMTNPPPEYASESGGVINIITKKGKVGLTGKVTLSTGSRGEGNLATNMSYRQQKFSFNTTFGIGGTVFRGDNYSRRENFYRDSSNKFNTEGNFKNRNLRPNLRFKVDYEIDKYKGVGFTYQGNLNLFHNFSTTSFTNINRFNQPYRFSSRENESIGNGYSHAVTFNYSLKGKKTPGEVLRIILNGNVGKNDNDRDFFQLYATGDFLPIGDSTQNQFFNTFSNGFSGRLSYDKPLGKKVIFSTGATFQRNNYHSLLNTSFLSKTDSTFVQNDLLSNDFKFHQNVSTIRAAATLNLAKGLRIIAGVQAEHTQMDFEFFKGNSSDVANDYWNVLPTLTIRKEFNKELNTSLIYRATIRRPGLGELNPNIDYSDPFNLRFGNPFLEPTLADNYDWTVSYIRGKYYFNTSVGYNKIKNIFNSIRTLIEAGKTQVTWLNIADRDEYEASIWGGYSFSKKFRLNASAGYSFVQYGEAEKLLYKYIDGSTFYTSVNFSFIPNSTLTFDGSGRYSSFATPQGRSRSNLTMNLGVQKKFFNKRFIVGFNIIDPFRVQQQITQTFGTNFNLESFNSVNTRNFRVSFSYQLNKMVKKSTLSNKQKKAALEKAAQKKSS
jgi:outer membrane receptor for ferrienterochelin and colicin